MHLVIPHFVWGHLTHSISLSSFAVIHFNNDYCLLHSQIKLFWLTQHKLSANRWSRMMYTWKHFPTDGCSCTLQLSPQACADKQWFRCQNGFVRYTAVLKQHRHIRVVKHGISFPNSLNLLGFKGLPGSTQLSYKTAIKFPDFEFVMIDICSPF